MASEKAPERFGRYEVLETLGSGAMGVVYLAVDPRLARPVAIKVLRESEFMTPAEREQYRDRFRHEAEAAGRLNHPGIVQIYDVGPSYIVMEFLEGRPLSAFLKKGGMSSVGEVAALVLRVADAIDHAHRHGIVHRDIKPANIMLLEDGGVKVMDFGVARLDTSNLTAAGTVVGSVRYMAPEQMMGEKVDGRADVFSLAAVTYELLTGRAPFPGKTITEVVSRVVHGGHVPPRDVDERLPEALNGIFARALAPSPADRYPRAPDFARELHAAAKGVLGIPLLHRGIEETPTRVAAATPTLSSPTPTVSVAAHTVASAGGVASAAGVAVAAPSSPASTSAAAASAVAASSTGSPAAGSPASSSGSRPGPATLARLRAMPLPAGDTILMSDAIPREGVLDVDSDPPRAQVFLDGTPIGEAPIGALEVAFGRHLVRWEMPGREPVSLAIEVTRERPLRALSVTLPPAAGTDAIRPGRFVVLGPGVSPPRRLSGPAPTAPDAARERGLEGAPVADVWISEAGEVIDAVVVESAGALLDAALLAAVRAWRFAPATLDGTPVSVRMTVQHLFRG